MQNLGTSKGEGFKYTILYSTMLYFHFSQRLSMRFHHAYDRISINCGFLQAHVLLGELPIAGRKMKLKIPQKTE